MTAGVMGGGAADEEKLERQMGCMAVFLQLFDRHQILSGKRLNPMRRLPSSQSAGSISPSERSKASPASFVEDTQMSPSLCPSSPESRPPTPVPARPSLPIFDVKDGMKTAWKIRDGPRLSLDSRAVVDAKGKLQPRQIRTVVAPISCGPQSDASDGGDESERQRRSPSVVARLMGLDALPTAGPGEPKPAELRRSASESRVLRDPYYYRFVDASFLQKPPPAVYGEGFPRYGFPDPAELRLPGDLKAEPAARAPASPFQRKSFFDTQDVFPELKRPGSIALYGEIERRLRMPGIDEPAKDLETLKQILEAVQLKGLLHSHPTAHNVPRRRAAGDSPIVLMKPVPRRPRFAGSDPPRRGAGAATALPRRDRAEIDRSNERIRRPRSPDPSSPASSPRSPARRSGTNTESQRSPQPQRRISAVPSVKPRSNVVGPDSPTVRSPRVRRPAAETGHSPAEDDTTTTVSDSSTSASSQIDLERSKAEERRSGRGLLDRCDKLLSSIAAITTVEQVTAVDQQRSPVSVLDSFFLGDESSPSPVVKRAVDFKDQLAGSEEEWDRDTETVGSEADDGDYLYVSAIVRARDRYGDSADAYARLEMRHRSCGSAWLDRRLVFDAVAEILDRKRQAPSWDAFQHALSLPAADGSGELDRRLIREVWAEVRRVREPLPAADDLNDVTCGAICRDMAADLDGWARPAAEMSDAVLQIERQVFKDLVAETIGELADVASGAAALRRRKLLF